MTTTHAPSLYNALPDEQTLADTVVALEIVAVVVNMNVWTRIKFAEGAMPARPELCRR